MIIYVYVYRLGIAAYTAAIRLAALFDHTARLFTDGRKGLLQKMRRAFEGDPRPRIWMHCASLGEFEQGRPVLESLHERYPGYCIVVTFFSPSGYEVRKNYEGADHVFYLPMDTNDHAREFLYIVQPKLCVFVKYEFWYFYLTHIAAAKIPAILLSAVFRKEQGFFRWYGGLQRRMLSCFSHLFVQDLASKELLATIKINNVSVSGDTRFDRVIMAAKHKEDIPVAATFCAGHKIIVAGSTYMEDEVFLQKVMALLPAEWKLIIAPHETDPDHIFEIEKVFGEDVIKWTDCPAEGLSPAGDLAKRVLLVNKVGFLLQLYGYATITWVGGGFGKDGVHNVLEAAVYGVPCFYGPVYEQFIEAKKLVESGGAQSVADPAGLVVMLHEIEDTTVYRQQSDAAKAYVLSGGGATKQVMDHLENFKIIT